MKKFLVIILLFTVVGTSASVILAGEQGSLTGSANQPQLTVL